MRREARYGRLDWRPPRAAVWVLVVCCQLVRAQPAALVEGRNITVEFDRRMHSRVIARLDGRRTPLGDFSPSEFLRAGGRDIADLQLRSIRRRAVRDALGAGRQTILTGQAPGWGKIVTATTYDDFPRSVFFVVEYTNTGSEEVTVEAWTSHRYSISQGSPAGDPPFWSFQPASYSKRPDWVLPLRPGFRQENYLGMNATDYGGGTPVADVWRRDAGLAVGHIETVPRLVSLPIEVGEDGRATIALRQAVQQKLAPGGRLKTYRTFVAVHKGDHFQSLRNYSRCMARQGLACRPAPESAFLPIWCAWGY
ncbi:MAG: alpha-galactosidase, partial [Bryobacteraceae bacterium]